MNLTLWQMFKKTLLKGLGEINTDIGNLKTPQERNHARTYLMIVLILITVVSVFWNIIRNDQKEKVKYLETRMAELSAECKERDRRNEIEKYRNRFEMDSLKQAIFDVVKEMYENRLETVTQKKILIKKAKAFLKR